MRDPMACSSIKQQVLQRLNEQPDGVCRTWFARNLLHDLDDALYELQEAGEIKKYGNYYRTTRRAP